MTPPDTRAALASTILALAQQHGWRIEQTAVVIRPWEARHPDAPLPVLAWTRRELAWELAGVLLLCGAEGVWYE